MVDTIANLLCVVKSDDRNLATGILLIPVKLRHHFGLRVEQPVALLTLDFSSLGLELLAADLDRHLGMREERDRRIPERLGLKKEFVSWPPDATPVPVCHFGLQL
jgi:hypothetical protein